MTSGTAIRPTLTMQFVTPTRYRIALALALCPVLHAQAPPSQLPAATPTAQSQSAPRTHRAEVAFTTGQLSISADNSSLNQILREVSRQTGMKITGGVTEDHVFGKYGPAKPAQVLAELLQGSGSNMILIQNGAATPTELILTPRTGGATPPNPNAPGFNDGLDDSPPQSLQSVLPRPMPTEGSDPGRPLPTPQPLPGDTQPPPATPDPSQDQAPNGVKTPQQIYDQLMKLRQQAALQSGTQTTPQ